MENRTVQIEGLLLTGKSANIISSLAIVGAASIIGGITYVSYKLGERSSEKKSLKNSIKNFIERIGKKKD